MGKFKLNRLYKDKGIQYIISISFTIIAVIGMITLGQVLYIKFINVNEEISSKNNKDIVNQVNLNLDRYLRSVMKISDGIYYNVIKKKDLSVDEIKNEMSLIYETNKDFIASITLFSKYGEVIDGYPLKTLKNTIDPRENEWFLNAIKRKENLHFSTPHVQNLFKDPGYTYKWVVSLSRAVELTEDGGTSQGVLLVDMNFSEIERIFKNTEISKSGYIYLMDGKGEIIYHPRQQLIYSDLIDENNDIAKDYEDGTRVETFDKEKRLVTVKTVGYTGWKIVAVTPFSDITESYSSIKIFTLVILFFAVLILATINIVVSSRIANPIKALEKKVKKFEEGALNIDFSTCSGSNEVKHLGKAINSMIAQMNILMDNIVFEQELKRKTELDALQAQINPHFLYNTLDSIVWMIESEKYSGAITMVTSLARFFRISLSKGRNVITVKEELEHVRNYLTIQNIRYKNKFNYNIEFEDDVLSLASIKLIIQPLVENAIYHGMEFMDGDGEINIKAYKINDDLYIDVIDNGLGMPDYIVETLLYENKNIKSKGSGVGLKNVNERIKLYFGKNYGLEIYSEPDEGTTIRIHMKAIEYSDFEIKEGNKK
ncbi:sensor histidine kinase [Clostridium baratii]|uniref:histidine kinase n=1 Tax=Clostridium baratii TaxID=1561 RepID=A0A174SKD0_9CLOT|nr:sensor histidine kinase [Clostridium baratii]CUP95650.1 multi-sensor signal transduction histidine kinase [Clostridium baratii]